MPRGGYREGSGRKKGSIAVKHAPLISDMNGLMPIDWLLAVLRDPLSEPARRDAIAIACMPYLHPRLSTVTSTVDVKGGGDTINNNNTVNIYAVPRGAALDLKDGVLTIEGTATELTRIEPFTGTPALTDDSSEQTNKVQPDNADMARDSSEHPLPVQEVDTSNVTRLKRPDAPGAMVQRVFAALDKRNAGDPPDNP
jgi:hypothetical protein